MSISGISSSSYPPGHVVRNDFQQLRDGFKGIDAALQAGDLDAAKQALDTFKQALQDLQSRRSDNAQPGQKNTRIGEDLDALDSALQSGDADAAKKAFETLTKDMQGVRHARGHHPHRTKSADGSTDQASTPAGATELTNTTGTGTTGTSGGVDLTV